MPQFVEGLRNAMDSVQMGGYHHPDSKVFLDAFLGNRLQKKDDTGSFSISPLTGDVELESPGGFKLTASPIGRSIQGQFRFGGPDRSVQSRSPEAALDAALGINPLLQMGPEAPSAGRQLMEQQTEEYLERNPYGYR